MHRYLETSICSAENFGVSYASVQRMFQNHKIRPYNFAKVQALKSEDVERRVHFCDTLLIRTQKKCYILFSINGKPTIDRGSLYICYKIESSNSI